MDKYEIGTRLTGYPKDYITSLTCRINHKYELMQGKKFVPHLTFLRPFETRDEQNLIETFNEVLCEFNSPISYSLDGFNIFKNQNKVVYANIEKNFEIEGIINSLEESLQENISFIHPKIFLPGEEKTNLHCAIASRDVNEYYSDILQYLDRQDFEPLEQPLYRVYLLRNKLILREYDFALRRSLRRWEAKDPILFEDTKEAFSLDL